MKNVRDSLKELKKIQANRMSEAVQIHKGNECKLLIDKGND